MIKRVLALTTVLFASVIYGNDYQPLVTESNSWMKDTGGCVLEDQLYRVGQKVAMNRKAISDREKRGQYVSDGEAIMMQCQYEVNPQKLDHPAIGERRYVWVSFAWGDF